MQLSEAQYKAAKHHHGPALVLAVPGSGKTTVLLHRIHELQQKGIDPSSILTVTFSKTQAVDMQERFDKADKVSFFTIHSFCYQLVRGYLRAKNRSHRLIESFDGFHKYDLLRRLYQAHTNRRMQKDEIEEFFRVYGYVKNTLQTNLSSYDALTVDLFRAYEECKREHHMLDFDDMLSLAWKVLQEEPDWLVRIQKRFPYVQLDEGQDTSKIQMLILRKIAEPNHNLFVLADDDQSIYGFRGADSTALLSFRDWYPNASFYYLSENYRSSPGIIQSATRVIRNNRSRYEKDIVATKESNGPVVHKIVPHLRREVQFLTKEMADIDPKKSTAILYRNHLSGLAVADAFNRKGIPFRARQKWDDFATHPVVTDLLTFLHLADHPHDGESFLRIYYKLGEFISKEQARYAADSCAVQTVWEALISPDLPEWRQDHLIGLRNKWRKLRRTPFKDRVKFIDEQLNYGKYLEEWTRTQTVQDNTRQIIDVFRCIAQHATTMDELMERLKPTVGPDDAPVILSTLHGAKGLEYDHVYMIDLIQPEFPGNLKDTPAEKLQLEEERRLFYVGMTRAREKLTLISLASRNGKRCEPTQFIQEIKR